MPFYAVGDYKIDLMRVNASNSVKKPCTLRCIEKIQNFEFHHDRLLDCCYE